MKGYANYKETYYIRVSVIKMSWYLWGKEILKRHNVLRVSDILPKLFFHVLRYYIRNFSKSPNYDITTNVRRDNKEINEIHRVN